MDKNLLEQLLAEKDQQIKELLDAIEDLVEALNSVVLQACWSDDDETYDSMCISSYALAIRLLDKWGRLKVTDDYGRRVIAVDKEKAKQ